MKQLLLILALGIGAVACTTEECTTANRSEWQDEDAFKQHLIEQGYKIQEFKVTAGNCYELYGKDKDQNKVEIYFNPVDGTKVKEEIH